MKLHERYPLVFSNGPVRFEHDSGWNDLLDRACAKIEAVLLRLPEEHRKYYYMAYTKEKYAGLVLVFHEPDPPIPADECGPTIEAGPGYDRGVSAEIDRIIEETEAESYTICEECGKPGVPRYYSWAKTHCDDCFKPDELCPEAWEGMIRIC